MYMKSCFIRSPSSLLSDPQKSASRFVVTEDGHQFYMTGDIAFRDENGYYHFKVCREFYK